MKIYSNGRQNMFVSSAMCIAAIAGVQVEEVFTTQEERQAADYQKKFGHTKCPALETEEGCLTESVAICKYFARKNADAKLLGSSLWEEAQVDQWLAFAHTNLLPNFFKCGYGIFGWAPVEQEVFNEASKNIRDQLKLLNTALAGKKHLVGDRITVADVVLAHFVQLVFQVLIETNQRKQFANVEAWWKGIAENEHYIKRNGKVNLCGRPIKPQVIAKPKEEKKKAAPAPAPKKEEKKEKEINPLEALPPSSFNMYDFKTFFVNEPDQKGKGMEELWKQYDAEGYSFWLAEYEKYEGEGEQLFLTQNLMNGFLQRADHFRKHAWATMAIVGDEPNLDIVSVWMFRGQVIPQEMIDHPQFEYYKKTKLDHTNEEHKKLISEFWCFKQGDGKLQGRTVQDAKMHK